MSIPSSLLRLPGLALLLLQAGPASPRPGSPAPGPASGREPVLKQIAVPHSYYYREMYLPQVTSGPGAAAWSPDGKELVYSMQGTLWRQRVGTTEAVQLTDGPGYDSEPDWSPDGRWIVYTSYRNDALELWLLDTRDGGTRPLVANGAANLDARWSPDGARIAYVSTAHEGRWHLFIVQPFNCPTVQPSDCPTARLTTDTASALPRYYYSRFDHYLSPAWSPDGRELLLVSNRGHLWGSGGIWRTEARAGAPMREIRNEETNWRVHPDWSPDGRRVVYSSYLGGQRNQLWVTTADGGDPFQLAYSPGDQTSPRWSPDGRRIVFVSNETGNTTLRIVEVPGGKVAVVAARTRRYLHPAGTLRITVADAAGRALPARISVTGPDGRAWSPDTAWRHADDAFDRSTRKFEIGWFHAAGPATLSLPAGRYTVAVSHGLEYATASRTVTVAAGKPAALNVRLGRLLDLPAAGWWSGDLHVHMNYGGAYRNDPRRLRAQAEAEDLHVVEDLIVNKEQRIPDIAQFLGHPDPLSTARTILSHDQEYHTSWWGHTGLLGLKEHLLLPGYVGYANTAAASLLPDNATVFAMARAQGGVTGYVHPFEIGAPDPAAPAPFPDGVVSGLANELPVDVALGLVDYLEIVGFADHHTTADVWYRLLNTGYRIPAGAGTDAMMNYASLRGPLGLNRVYVKSGPRLDYRSWLAALKAGKTFATNGPLLSFSLEGREPGAEIILDAGVHRLQARVSLRSIVPVDHLEIVANGAVVAPVPLTAGGTRADAVIPLPVARSGWFTLRAWSDHATEPIMDLYPFATTSPVYVSVGPAPIRSARDAEWFVHWIERLEAGAAAHPGWNSEAEKREVLDRLARAKAEFVRLGAEAGR